MAPTIQTRLYEYERDCTRYEYACEEDIDDPWWVGVKLDMQRCSSGPLSLFKRHYVYLTYRYAYPWQLSACWWLVVESSRKKAARTHARIEQGGFFGPPPPPPPPPNTGVRFPPNTIFKRNTQEKHGNWEGGK